MTGTGGIAINVSNGIEWREESRRRLGKTVLPVFQPELRQHDSAERPFWKVGNGVWAGHDQELRRVRLTKLFQL